MNLRIKYISYFNNIKLTTNQLLLFTSCYIALILNLPFLIKSTTIITALDNYNLFFLVPLPIFLLALTIIIQGLFSFRWLTKPLLIATVICSALVFYGTISYEIVFDYGMVKNTIETDTAEAWSYINFHAIIFFIFFGLLPSFIIYSVQLIYKPLLKELLSRLKIISLSLISVFLIGVFFYSNYAAVGRNNKDLITYIISYKMMVLSFKLSEITIFTHH
ncbi:MULTISPECIES: DUF1705 domain-containing protein [unclassified Colwellia]|jgi:lipid A ethanolaminephosphotransferase|uniref:DUF1705 domain-containing protein n=1 Tax=unclassified Colwellia TaxID=196834 RepID=UPI0021750367|nr:MULTISPECIES: DUF1705 domain-containing protein [unclassified Colwellia]